MDSMKHYNPNMYLFVAHVVIVFIQTCFSRSIDCLRSLSGLVMLLQDPDPVVRVKAAEAMGHFH